MENKLGLSTYDFDSKAISEIWRIKKKLAIGWSDKDYDPKVYALGLATQAVLEYRDSLIDTLNYRANEQLKEQNDE